MRFQNSFVTTSVCWVSRSVVLTGQWARTHAQRDAMPTVTPRALSTIYPLQLRVAGYRTGHFGKWHMIAPRGFDPAAQYDVFEAIGRNPYNYTIGWVHGVQVQADGLHGGADPGRDGVAYRLRMDPAR